MMRVGSFKPLALALAVGFAMLMLSLAAWLGGEALLEPVGHYRQTVLWMTDETLGERLRALAAEGRQHEAMLYGAFHNVALGFLAAMACCGALVGWYGGKSRQLPLKQAKILAGGLVMLALISPLVRPMMAQAADEPQMQMALVAMPAYWLVGLIASASVLGLYLALGTHDLGLYVRERLAMQPLTLPG